MPELEETAPIGVAGDAVLAVDFGTRLRHARQRAGLTQQQLAQGRYTKAYVSALEHGAAKPSMAALHFLARRLGVAPAQLLTDEAPGWTRLQADMNLATGQWQAAADAYAALLEAETEHRKRAELLRGRAEALCRLDRADEAISVASSAAEIFTRLGRDADAALATYWLAYALYERDNGDEAAALLTSLLDRIRAGLDAEPDLKLRILMALASVELRGGQHHRAVTYLEEARGLADDLDDRRRATFLFSLAISYRETGDLEGAIRAGTQGLALYRAAGAALEAASIENDLALAYLALGNLTRASDLAHEARHQFEELGDARWLAHVTETEAQIALARGDPDSALKLAGEALEMAEASDNVKARTSALMTQAKAHAAAGRTDDALAIFEQLAALVRESGPRASLREVLTAWAELLAERGDHERAYELAREALADERSAR